MNFFTASAVRFGPLSIATPLLYLLAGITGGSIVLILITKNNRAGRDFSSDIISGFFLFLILSWKLLPVLLSPGEAVSNPMMILYSTGGAGGIILGAVVGIFYLTYRFFNFRKYFAKKENGEPVPDIILKDLLKPVMVFFIVMGLITSSLFISSALVRKSSINGTETASQRNGIVPGDIAPGFELQDVAGNIVNIDNYRGRWIILNFWATWCPPCRAEIPGLIKFYNSSDKEKIVLLGINASRTEKPDGNLNSYIEDFMQKNGMTFPVLLDIRGSVSSAYGATSIPTTVVISPRGIVTKIKTGVVDSSWLKSAVAGKQY